MAKKTGRKKGSPRDSSKPTSSPKEGVGIGCVLKHLPKGELVAAAVEAVEINPMNAPPSTGAALVYSMVALETSQEAIRDGDVDKSFDAGDDSVLTPYRLALLTTKYWGTSGVNLTVGFMEQTPDDLANRIVSHMNAWNSVARANTVFTLTKSLNNAIVRVTREMEGYWSYLGTDVKRIPRDQPTMCLQGFTMRTSESEFIRVVRHEAGHTLGFVHEHLRRDLVARLNRTKTIAYFRRNQGWSAAETEAQVLTPVEEASLLRPTMADARSIMCYQLPGEITNDGQPISGGDDIDETDGAYARSIYPSVVAPPPPPPGPPPVGRRDRTLVVKEDGTWVLDGKVI